MSESYVQKIRVLNLFCLASNLSMLYVSRLIHFVDGLNVRFLRWWLAASIPYYMRALLRLRSLRCMNSRSFNKFSDAPLKRSQLTEVTNCEQRRGNKLDLKCRGSLLHF